MSNDLSLIAISPKLYNVLLDEKAKRFYPTLGTEGSQSPKYL